MWSCSLCSQMASVLSDQSEGGGLPQPNAGGSTLAGLGAGGAAARSLAVSAAIKVLDTQLYVVRGLAVAAIKAGQAIVAARTKVRTQPLSVLTKQSYYNAFP